MPTVSDLNMQNKNARNSSIELLRIIAMVLIVLCHFGTYGESLYGEPAITASRLWWNLTQTGGNLGTNVYVLISGYFLIKDESSLFNIKRILKFWGQVFFYSATMFIIFYVIAGTGEFTLKALIKNLMPITFKRWWFASTYFVLYIIHPFLNKLLLKIDKSTYQKLIALLIICWSIIPTFTTADYESNPLIWFVCLYAVAGYIRLYGLNKKFTSRHYLGFWALFTLITYLSSFVFTVLGQKWDIFAEHIIYFYERQTILSLLRSLGLFMTFVEMKMNCNKLINIAASATFGVYLIHENIGFKHFVWGYLFKSLSFDRPIKLILFSLAATAVMYIACTAIDLARKYTVEKVYMTAVNRFSDKLMIPVRKAYLAVVKFVTE